MNRHILLFILLLHFISFSFGQVVIRGKVVDSVGNDFLPYATIRILHGNSDSLVQGTISDTDGKYIFENINFGKYTIVCNFIGFEIKKTTIEFSTRRNETLDIYLIPNSTTLNEVVVKGSSIKYREQFNKTIVRPDSFDIKSATSAFDILRCVQGIQVDPLNGTVNLAGETNTLVLINNISVNRQKPLSSILPEDIERIEIINNPSSKYDSEYSGIINILLKKERNLGMSLNSNLGVLYNFALCDLNIEYSKDKYRIFVTSDNKFRFLPYDMYEDRNYVIDNNSYSYTYKELNSSFQKLSNTVLLGADFFLNSNNIVNVTFRSDIFDYISENEGIATSNFTEITKNQTTKSIFDGNDIMHNVSFFYKKTFKNPNKELLVDANYYLFNSSDTSSYSNNISYGNTLNPISYIRGEREKDQKHSYNVKLDYTDYLNDNVSYEVGYNFYSRFFNNAFTTFTDENVFKMREDRNSLYSDLFLDFKKLSLWAGVRYEFTASKINNENTIIKDAVLPNAGMSLQLSKTYRISAGYKKYLTRPDIWQLNPFVYTADSLNFSSGNPLLIPSSTNNVELKHTFYKENKQISIVFYSNWSKDIIDNVFIIGEKSSTYEIYKNIAQNNTFGTKINFAFSYRVWKFSAFFNGYYDEFMFFNKTNNGFGYDFSLTCSVDLPKSFFAGFYMYSPGSKRITSQGDILASQRISQIYFGKSVFKNKGKLHLIIFNLLGDKTKTNTTSINYNSVQKTEVGSFSAGIYFTYFFNKGKETKRLDRQYNMEKNSKAKY